MTEFFVYCNFCSIVVTRVLVRYVRVLLELSEDKQGFKYTVTELYLNCGNNKKQ